VKKILLLLFAAISLAGAWGCGGGSVALREAEWTSVLISLPTLQRRIEMAVKFETLDGKRALVIDEAVTGDIGYLRKLLRESKVEGEMKDSTLRIDAADGRGLLAALRKAARDAEGETPMPGEPPQNVVRAKSAVLAREISLVCVAKLQETGWLKEAPVAEAGGGGAGAAKSEPGVEPKEAPPKEEPKKEEPKKEEIKKEEPKKEEPKEEAKKEPPEQEKIYVAAPLVWAGEILRKRGQPCEVSKDSTVIVIKDKSAAVERLVWAVEAQRQRIAVMRENVANAETTAGADGKPYRRKTVVVKEDGAVEVAVDPSPLRRVQDPAHKDAVKDPASADFGCVYKPNVDAQSETASLAGAVEEYNILRQIVERLDPRHVIPPIESPAPAPAPAPAPVPPPAPLPEGK